jgi:hypothetical protein
MEIEKWRLHLMQISFPLFFKDFMTTARARHWLG